MTDMQTYGAQLQEMGYGFEEGATLIGQLGKEGVNVTEVLGAMKKSVTTMAKSGVSATKGMEQYYTAIKNAGTATEATKIASEVFGARAASTMAAAIRSGSMAVDDLTASLKNNGETIAGAAADTYDFSEKWTMFKNRMAVAVEPAATAVFEKLGDVFDRLAPKMEELSPKIAEIAGKAADGIGKMVDMAIKAVEWVGKNSDVVLALAGAVGTAVVAYKAIKGVMTVYNTLTSLSKVLSIASTAASAGQTAATVAQTAATTGAIAPTTALAAATTALNWPILLVVAAIAAVVAIIILLVKHWDKVKAAGIAVWNAIKSAGTRRPPGSTIP
jgi:phage-related minor tail protein